MKRILSIIAAFLFSGAVLSQVNPVDELFEKYSQKEGFTAVYISAKMLGLIGSLEAKSGNTDNVMLRLKSIRILTENDSIPGIGVNFYSELSKKLNMSDYEELMVVQEKQNITKFLIRQNGDRISELLMISGGTNGNSIISIKGDINLKELSEISETLGVEELQQLEGIEKKKD